MEKLIYIDIAAKRRKKHINEISGVVISMCYNKKKIENLTFYESIKFKLLSRREESIEF